MILTVSGNIGVTNAPGVAKFDRAMLDTMPQTTVVSYTDWTEGPQTFQGVLLGDLIARVEGRGVEIVVTALNDYGAIIPWSDLDDHAVLLALMQNGAPMSVRDKGPIWIIYPDSEPKSEPGGDFARLHNGKMVWQLNRIEVR
ncbi:MAG TPA: molybdopterin-dependent oxidoreductase [Arenibaculum sp.]|nr:molybdopterin-dependent oxidoreductase [Arenibaculum sp.]